MKIGYMPSIICSMNIGYMPSIICSVWSILVDYSKSMVRSPVLNPLTFKMHQNRYGLGPDPFLKFCSNLHKIRRVTVSKPGGFPKSKVICSHHVTLTMIWTWKISSIFSTVIACIDVLAKFYFSFRCGQITGFCIWPK